MMKKTILLTLLAGVMGWSSCTSDDSTGATVEVGEIEVTGMEESMDVESYMDVNLKDLVKPQITTTYSDDQLAYAWYLFDTGDTAGQGYSNPDYLISSGKEPDYIVNLPSGTYKLVFEVKALTNDYTVLTSTNLRISTPTSRCFYVLKETIDGRTELDVVSPQGDLLEDMIEKNTGAPMQGKPYNLSILYNGEFVNPGDNETAVGNLVQVFTDANQYKGFRTEDMKEVFNNDNLFYSGTMEPDEAPYTFFKAMLYNCYMSNTGIRAAYNSAELDGVPGTGMMGYPACDGGSKFVQALDYYMYYVYWSNTLHQLLCADFNVQYSMSMPYMGPVAVPDDLECLSSGSNSAGGSLIAYFLCEQPSSGERYLFLMESGMMVDDVVKLDPDSHLAKSSVIAGNGLSASYIYCVDGNKLYVYDIRNQQELTTAISLPGIPESETISFVTNQYLDFEIFTETAYNFDTFIVGTQTGNEYKLYFYQSSELNGGLPIGEASMVVPGTGSVKAVRFVCPISLLGMNLCYSTNPFPLSD